MFMGPYIVNVLFKYNQQDATLYNILYYCQCSTCSRRLLRPSSGAQKLYTLHQVYVNLAWCYQWMVDVQQRTQTSSNSPTLAVAVSKLGI